MKRIAFFKWMKSWTQKYGHRWQSVPRGQDAALRRTPRAQAVRCTECGVRVSDRGKVTTAATGYGAGEREPGRGLKPWIEAALPACTSLEKVMREVMES